MCDPVSAGVALAGMATSAVATNNQTRSANRNLQAVQTAKEEAYRQGMGRQTGYADEAGQAFTPMVQNQGADSFRNQLTANTADRLQAFNDGSSTAPDYTVSDGTPKNVAMAMEKAFGESDETTSRDRTALAKLGGYGDTQFDQGLGRNEFARAFGNLSDKASRDSNLIGMDMNTAANNAFKAPNAALSLAKQAGKMATMYGAAGMPGSGMGGITNSGTAVRGVDGTPMPVLKPGIRPAINRAFGGYGPNTDMRG